MDTWNGEAPRNVLSNETIRAALARANSASVDKGMEKPASPKRTNTAGSSRSSRPPSERRDSERRSSKKAPPHENCDCLDCRDLSYRDKQGSTRTDKNGDKVKEWDSEEAPRVHCHVQPGLFEGEEERPSAPRRSTTHGSSRSERRRSPDDNSKSNTSTTINKEGDHVQEWDGSEAPPVRTHYDWDAAENKAKR